MDKVFLFFAILAFLHFVFDFILQTDEEATNKSKSTMALLSHVGKYGIGMQLGALAGAYLFGGGMIWIAWAIGNTILHFGTDFVTSRATSRYWTQGKKDAFFNTIGFDQMVHSLTLIGMTFIVFVARGLA